MIISEPRLSEPSIIQTLPRPHFIMNIIIIRWLISGSFVASLTSCFLLHFSVDECFCLLPLLYAISFIRTILISQHLPYMYTIALNSCDHVLLYLFFFLSSLPRLHKKSFWTTILVWVRLLIKTHTLISWCAMHGSCDPPTPTHLHTHIQCVGGCGS